jgi:transcriptional regulator with PAS, ATPase and Fis domain
MEDMLLVAPYPELAELAERLKEKTSMSFSTIVANLHENFDTINESIKGGSKLIVTRGGTAEYLRKTLSVPVIEIPVTSFDILRSISNVSSKGYKNIAFITTSNIIFKTEHFNKIVDITLQFESCKDVKDIPGKVQSLIKNSNVEAIIGDVIATNEALKYGIYGEILKSGEESLIHALKEAKHVLEISKKERARIKEVETILNMIDEGVLTIDRNETVTVYNTKAEKIFGKPKEDVIGKKLKDCLPVSTLHRILENSRNEINTIMDINNQKLVSSRISIDIDGEPQGAVAIFDEVKSIQNLEMKIRKKLNEKGLVAKHTFDDIIGESSELKKLKYQARRFAGSEGTILIYGETGTGKEVFAQSIHNSSRRADGPFVSLNCAAINESLLESELFGYEEGSFTGAVRGGKAGLFELAHGGTLFLDEIGETSLSFQAKILRVLQEREIRKIGGDKVIPVDVRIICATNRNLKEEVRNKNFREDLFYRLSVLELKLSPLRERKADIIPTAISFMKAFCINEQRNMQWKNNEVFNPLLNYNWPGNARELRNFMERLVICCAVDELTEVFVREMLSYKFDDSGAEERIYIKLSKDIKEMENEIMRQLLVRYEGDKDKLCKAYNISKTTLWRKINFKNEI